jgi:hypothetical protein
MGQALDRVFPSLDDVLHAASLQPNAARYQPLPNTRHKIQAPQALGLKPGAGVCRRLRRPHPTHKCLSFNCSPCCSSSHHMEPTPWMSQYLHIRPSCLLRLVVLHLSSTRRGTVAENLHPLWKRFNEYHTSPAFYDEMVALLGDAMARSKVAPPHSLRSMRARSTKRTGASKPTSE